MARGSIGIHCAWDDTTAKLRISSRNDGAAHFLAVQFNCVEGFDSGAPLEGISVTMPIAGHRLALDLMETTIEIRGAGYGT